MTKYTSILLAIALLACASCASTLNGKHQKVKLQTSSASAKVYVDDDYAGKGKTVIVKLKRDYQVRQFRVENDGYKPAHSVAYQTTKSPLYIMSWVPFGILIYPPLMDFGPKSFNYKKEFVLKSGEKIKTKDADGKYIYLKNASVNVKKEDLRIEQFSKTRYDKNKASKNVTKADKAIIVDNSVFSDVLEDILKENKYYDTIRSIFKTKTNTLYLSATITKITGKAIELRGARSYLITDVFIDWEVLDFYQQPKLKVSVKGTSGEFSLNLKEGKETFMNSVEDAITVSFLKMLDDPKVKPLLVIEKESKVTLASLSIPKPDKSVASLSQAQNATVTIVTKNGHGSGCVVSADGYILTAYHVIAGSEEVEIITNEGTKAKAEFIRSNEVTDIALLKTDLKFDVPYVFPAGKTYEVGQDVFAVGTPTNIELGQTLSKGIISGIRKQGSVELIQTDVSVNRGNSGGALVDSKGNLIGIVNSKMIGLGVEGISFNVPASSVAELLSIKYE